eukprot:2782288-Amphidinium_carterae.1
MSLCKWGLCRKAEAMNRANQPFELSKQTSLGVATSFGCLAGMTCAGSHVPILHGWVRCTLVEQQLTSL